MDRWNSLTIARENQRGSGRRTRSVGSCYPTKTNALLETFCEEIFAKIQFSARRGVVTIALGFVFAQRYGDRMGVEHQFAPDGVCECKSCIVCGGNGIFGCRGGLDPNDETFLGEPAHQNERQ